MILLHAGIHFLRMTKQPASVCSFLCHCAPETLPALCELFSSNANCEITFIACVQMKCTRARCAALSFSFSAVVEESRRPNTFVSYFLTCSWRRARSANLIKSPPAALCAENLAAPLITRESALLRAASLDKFLCVNNFRCALCCLLFLF
jgi:hypothetical protein